MKMSDSSGEPAVGVGAGVANGQVIRLLSGSTYGIAARSNDQEFNGSNPPSVQVNANLVSSNTMTRMVSVNSGSPGRVAVSRPNSGLGSNTGNNISSLLMTGNTNLPNLVTTLTSPVRQRTSDVLLNSGSGVRKRKLSDSGEDIAHRRQRISEHKAARLKRIKERYVEHTSELFFLQAGGNIMELYAWRKRPPIPALVNFFKTNRLDPMDEEEDLVSLLGPLSAAQQQPEMKIAGGAGASVTPVAVSTTLPAAVARLSQQGHVPGRPVGGRHGMVFASRQPTNPQSITSTTPCTTSPLHQALLVPGGMPLDPEVSVVGTSSVDKRSSLSPNKVNKSSPASRQHSISAVYDNSIGSQEQIVEKAKQEAHVMQRIGELQREGLWAEKRLPKVHEPPRAKAHWDYLIEEMVWLAADFAQERKWKKAAAKKCARMVQKYFQEKELMALKAVKTRELQLKRIASCMSKEIKIFWANVEKIVEFKQQTRLEEKRKKALDQHLSFIVDQTEKYSTLVAESMNKMGGESVPHSVGSSRVASPSREHHSSDVEFEPGGTSSDDEETIAKAEAEEGEAGAIDHAAEVEMLKQESELPLEDLLKDYLDNRENINSSPSSIQDDGEYHASDKDSSDDEETIHEQEKAEGEVDHGQELEDLKAEGEMSLDELMAKYGGHQNSVQTSEQDSDVEVEEVEDENDSETEAMEEDREVDESQKDDGSENSEQEEADLSTLLNDDTSVSQQPTEKDQTTDEEINDVAAIAQSIQPTGNTLSSTSVVTKIPFLLKHTLREYQHIGLDWLVTMHDRKLNGILADEMGLGKTIQTISVLAHLACEKGIWGPHLIIVPTSVMLNWEMEFKKWCPAFKILTYYGTQKERRLKRTGWTKPNAFHICITSYKLVIQDHQSFRRKKWKYLILDEAQNIKNFKSQRWQLLLNFQTQRRLLLTGTPLQNNLMELWSLMHFLMPNVFQSHKEFKEWFSNPVTGMIEGNTEYNDQIIKRLHKVLRPFLLRRLKTEVEKQLPKKYEHIVVCRLSNRQRYLYDDFMSRARTRETLASGNLLSVINVLMQLRKVCNHPNLFEPRPTVSPFQMEAIEYHVASLIWSALDYDPDKHVDLTTINLRLIDLDMNLSAFTAHRMRKYRVPNKLIEEIDSAPNPPPRCPPGKIKIHVKFSKQPSMHSQVALRQGIFSGTNNTKPSTPSTPVPKICTGTSPLIRTTILGQTPTQGLTLRVPCGTGPQTQVQSYSVQLVQHQGSVKAIPVSALGGPQPSSSSNEGTTPNIQRLCSAVTTGFAQLVQTTSGRHLLFTSSPQVLPGNPTVMTTSGQRLTVIGSGVQMSGGVARLAAPGVAQISGTTRPLVRMPPLSVTSSQVTAQVVTTIAGNSALTSTVTTTMPVASVKTSTTVTQPVVSVALTPSTSTCTLNTSPSSVTTRAASKEAKKKIEEEAAVNEFLMPYMVEKRKLQRRAKLCKLAEINKTRCTACPMYGTDLVTTLRLIDEIPQDSDWTLDNWLCSGYVHCHHAHNHDASLYWQQTKSLTDTILSIEQRLQQLENILARYTVCVPAVAAPRPRLHVSHPPVWKLWHHKNFEARLHTEVSWRSACLHPIVSAMNTQFPDPRLIQYDCGKLQSLDRLLRRLKSEHHRVLIFTQMTRMLDILEAFLNHHGHIYLRLDGTTKIDQRQVLMERFNADRRIFCFILSTRSGGIGVNLTGADTVIFYDSDWNPTMDAQAQDRCHRIGQTRDVHIYRLISEKTVEENILKKANQKRLLGDLAIEGGNFTTAFFKSSTIQELFNVDVNENDASRRMAEVLNRDSDKKQYTEEMQVGVSLNEEKTALGVLENALAAAEDETDVTAAKTAKAEAAAELAEFDESIPLDQEGEASEEISKAEQEVNALMQQLSGVERYAMRFIEETEAAWSAEQLAAAEAEIEQQKREWEGERLAALQLEEEQEAQSVEEASEELLTFSREDSQNQVWVSQNGQELMPMWCPPTPPQDDSDVYIDHSLSFLYEQTTMSESQLPPVFLKKDRKRRMETSVDGRHPIKMRCHRRDETSLIHAPRSLFDRPSPALVKMRHDLRMQKYRGVSSLPVRTSLPSPLPGLKPPLTPVKPPAETENVPEWLIHEDWVILQAMQNIQELTLNLVVVSPGHTPNWDMVADMVNMVSRIYRSPKQCRSRYESIIIPREEGKIVFESNIKKPKKTKGVYKLPQNKCNRPMRTSHLFVQDNNSAFSQLMNARFEAIRSISNRRTPTVKPILDNTEMKNPKHAEVLIDSGIDYDNPVSPIDVATRRAERIAKEKNAAAQAQQLALFRGQVGATAAATAKPVVAASPNQSAATQQRPVTTLTVQDMVSNQSVSRTSTPSTSSTSPQRVATAVSQATTTTTAITNKVMTTGKLNPAQLQMYQHRQAVLRQQQIKALQTRAAAAVASGQKVSVAVTSGATVTHQPARIQQVKQTGVTRTVSESEMAAIIKRQAVAASSVSVGNKTGVGMSSAASLTPAQILAQAGLQAQQSGQVAALVKAVPAQTHIPVAGLTIPQVKAALGPGVKTSTMPQQIRQLTLQQQLMAQQRKLPAQKVTQLGQVMVTGKAGVPAQLIVQSQKAVPTTMTMQQIQQVIKHVHPQHITHVSAGGQAVVTQGGSGQVISHAVITKSQQPGGSTQTRVIPVATTQQNLKQTIQVVTGSPGVRTSVPNVTIDSSGRPNVSVASALAGAIKVGSPAQQQALLSQVSAALQQGQQIAVRQSPVRIQAAPSGTPLVAVAVSQAPTLLTLPQSTADTTQNQ